MGPELDGADIRGKVEQEPNFNNFSFATLHVTAQHPVALKLQGIDKV